MKDFLSMDLTFTFNKSLELLVNWADPAALMNSRCSGRGRK